jgi:hypothetical protein
MEKGTWAKLDDLRSHMSLGHEAMADRLALTPKRYSMLYFNKIEPPICAVEAMLEEFDIDSDVFFFGELDYKTLEAHARGHYSRLPERYTVAAYSKKRTVIPLLSCLEAFQGKPSVERLLSRFQCRPEAFQDPNEPINIRFVSDLCDHLSKTGFEDRLLYQMAKTSSLLSRDAELRKRFADCRNPTEVFEKITTQLGHVFDTNHSYKIDKIIDGGIRLTSRFDKAVMEELKQSSLGNKPCCVLRAGTLSTIPTIIGNETARVKKAECSHDGSELCAYDITFH